MFSRLIFDIINLKKIAIKKYHMILAQVLRITLQSIT